MLDIIDMLERSDTFEVQLSLAMPDNAKPANSTCIACQVCSCIFFHLYQASGCTELFWQHHRDLHQTEVYTGVGVLHGKC